MGQNPENLNNNTMKIQELTLEQFCLFSNLLELKRMAVKIWVSGVPTTVFCRLVHQDYQILFNDDLNSDDDFYNLSKPCNKPMLDLLNILGFEYSPNFNNICFPKANHDLTKLNFPFK